MNSELKSLYSSKWDKLCTAMESIIQDNTLEWKPTCPLLLSIGNEEDFKKADIRVMVYGQETNSWNNKFNSSIDPIIECYDNFFNKGECWRYGGQFWNGVGKFSLLLQSKYPTQKICLVWNNIVKIGKFADKGFPPDYIYEIEKENFNVIKEEIKIIKPTVVLFLTGPNYDSIINDNFGKINYSKLSSDFVIRQIAKVDLEDVPFAFRTYHPNYLWRNNINNYFKTIIDNINI